MDIAKLQGSTLKSTLNFTGNQWRNRSSETLCVNGGHLQALINTAMLFSAIYMIFDIFSRCQRIKIGDCLSSKADLKLGVPQGSMDVDQ